MKIRSIATLVPSLSGLVMFGLGCQSQQAEPREEKPSKMMNRASNNDEHSTAGEWGVPHADWASSLTTDRRTYRPGEPIIVSYRVRNASSIPRDYWFSSFWNHHELIVTSIDGRMIERTRQGEEIQRAFNPEGPRRKSIPVTIASDAIYEKFAPMNLADYYELASEKEILVRCHYREGLVDLWSNTLHLRFE